MSLHNEVPDTQSRQPSPPPYDRILQECLRDELRVVNAGLPRSPKRLWNLLREQYPHVPCNDGSTHFFKKSELQYLAGILDDAEQQALALPMLIELGVNQAEAAIVCEGKAEEKVISKALDMPVTCQQRRIRIYKPQLALLRSKFKTATVYVFSSKIVA
jgi:hypothetical protein